MSKKTGDARQRMPFIIAGVAAVLGAVLMQRHIGEMALVPKVEREQETYRVAVAARDLESGAEIGAADVEFKDVRLGMVPRHLYVVGLANEADERQQDKMRATLSGCRLSSNIKKGELLLKTDFDQAEETTLSGNLTSNQRAIAISVDRSSTMGGLLLPNDHVDVVARFPTTVTVQGEKRTFADKTQVLLQNVTILAVGGRLSRLDGGRSGGSGETVVLGLTPDEALFLGLVQADVRLSLLLRPEGAGGSVGEYSETEIEIKDKDVTKVVEKLAPKRQR